MNKSYSSIDDIFETSLTFIFTNVKLIPRAKVLFIVT